MIILPLDIVESGVGVSSGDDTAVIEVLFETVHVCPSCARMTGPGHFGRHHVTPTLRPRPLQPPVPIPRLLEKVQVDETTLNFYDKCNSTFIHVAETYA